jgi:hypothetical protein
MDTKSRRSNIFVFLLPILVILCWGSQAYEYELPKELEKWHVYDMDIPWRLEYTYPYDSGYWGLAYNWDPTIEETKLDSYVRIRTYRDRWNKRVRGPLVEGGQQVVTVFGANLGSKYSPFVTMLDEYTVGMRVFGYNFPLPGKGNIMLDGTYIIGYINRPAGDITMWEGPKLNNVQGDFSINLQGSYGGASFNNTIIRYYNKTLKDYFFNYAIEARRNFFNNRLSLEGVIGSYEENNDSVRMLKYNLNVIPSFLSFEWALHDIDIKDLSAIYGVGNYLIAQPIDPEERLLLTELRYLGNAINYGPTISFGVGETKNRIKLDYSTNAKLDFYSNCPVDAPENPRRLISFTTQYKNVFMQSSFMNQIPEEVGRKFYRFEAMATLENPLQLGTKASLLFDLDQDMGYLNRNETYKYSSLGLRLKRNSDILKFKNVELSAVFIMGLMDTYGHSEKFNYSWMAKYNAPNGLRIRLQFFSSEELTTRKPDIFGEDRYAPFRWYRNDYGKKGFRLIFALPY